ncbi:rCG38121 [Rattus norvegicus]|uniref:RCG38121 n=1 Tax=Rattus norvegicus TaxID=10116 RepID=A6IUY7_RAT|nr:rCG38121 [Rattus norvegicus]
MLACTPSRSRRWKRLQLAGAPGRLSRRFHDSMIKCPLLHCMLWCQHKPCFTTKRPNTLF